MSSVTILLHSHPRFLLCGLSYTWRLRCTNALRFTLVPLQNLLKALLRHDVHKSFDNLYAAGEVLLLSATLSVLISFILHLSCCIRLWSSVLCSVCNHSGTGPSFCSVFTQCFRPCLWLGFLRGLITPTTNRNSNRLWQVLSFCIDLIDLCGQSTPRGCRLCLVGVRAEGKTEEQRRVFHSKRQPKRC